MKNYITCRLNKILNNEGGATSIEYSLMAVLIAVVVVSAVAALGVAVNNLFVLASKW